MGSGRWSWIPVSTHGEFVVPHFGACWEQFDEHLPFPLFSILKHTQWSLVLQPHCLGGFYNFVFCSSTFFFPKNPSFEQTIKGFELS
jgi:hypothetical protein